MSRDATLLEQFARRGSEAAFAELVGRHLDLVHAAALRQVAGDAGKAQDVTQAVFCELARKAPALLGHPSLAGWLYSTGRHIASRLQRAETRRTARETASLAMNDTATEPEIDGVWKEIRPLLDEAMGELHEKDREAVILRFFQNRTMSEIGGALRLGENATRMRVERALERLRERLGRKGIKSSASLLGAALAANAVSAPPIGLASTVLGSALAGAAAAGAATTTTLPLLHFMTATQLKAGLATMALVGATTGLLVTQNSKAALEAELASLRAAAPEVERLRAENKRLGQVEMGEAEVGRLRAQTTELARLRGEVTLLKKELADAQAALASAAARPTPPQAAKEPALTPEERLEFAKNLGIAKMTVTRHLGGAMLAYAMEHGSMPADISDAREYLPPITPELDFLMSLASPSDFEIMYQGPLSDLKHPERTIILREKTPFNYLGGGAASRTYLFADGHSEIYKAPNGDFEPWERARLAPQANGGR